MSRHISPVLLWIFLGISLFLFTACGRNREPEIPVNLTPVAITYIAFGDNDAEEQLIQGFEETHPLITVERQNFNRQPSGYLLDETPPDVMLMWPGYQLTAAMENNLLADMDDVWFDAGLEESYPQVIQNYGVYEGKHFFMPIVHTWSAIYYNRAIFDRFGLTPPQSWEDFLNVCALLLNGGEVPLILAGGGGATTSAWFEYLDLRLNGPDFHQRLLQGKEAYDSPEVNQVFELWASLLDSGYVHPDSKITNEFQAYGGLTRGEGSETMSTRRAAMMLIDSFTIADLPPLFMDELDFFPFPEVIPGLPKGEIAIVPGYAIPAGAPHRPEAGTFLSYLSDPAVQALAIPSASQSYALIPVSLKLDENELPAKGRQGRELVLSADWVGPPIFLALPPSMENAINGMMRQMLDEDRDIAAIQQRLEAARQKAISQGEYRQE